MGQALYRTYRSKNLSEIIGQEHITQTLDNALKKGLISHAYLFTGPRGVGKTSIARILAHEINNLPYTDEQVHLDIIEIDAASNRRIDEIRDLRDKVHIAPASAKYKVYIIDEVHMLTREAFNALLKTLEEPPAHAIFILATTEIHKLPETIVSRTQRFAFKPVEQSKVIAHLQHIAKEEKIAIDDDALALIAAHGEGSFRDSISLLDQSGSAGSKKVTRADIERMLGVAPAEQINALVQSVQSHDSSTAVQTIRTMSEQGSNAALIAKQLGEQLRQSILDGQVSKEPALRVLGKLLDVAASPNPMLYLEIILLDATLSSAQQPATPINDVGTPKAPSGTKVPSQKAAIQSPSTTTPSPQSISTEASTPAAETPSEKATDSSMVGKTAPKPATPGLEAQRLNSSPSTASDDSEEAASDTVIDIAGWNQVLANIKKNHSTLYTILRSATPTFTAGGITLAFGFAFHQRRINEKRNKEVVASVIKSVTGSNIIIKCIVSEKKPSAGPELPPAELGEQIHSVPGPSTEMTSAPDEPEDYYMQQADAEVSSRPINAVSNIFGGAELLES